MRTALLGAILGLVGSGCLGPGAGGAGPANSGPGPKAREPASRVGAERGARGRPSGQEGGAARAVAEKPRAVVEKPRAASLPEAVAAFGLDLYGRLAQRPGNLFFSPWSIGLALAMTRLGARGQTLQEMEGSLRLPKGGQVDAEFRDMLRELGQAAAGFFQLVMANRLFVQQGYPLERRFVDAVRGFYGAAVQALDFAGSAQAAAQAINDWVARVTKGRIKHLVSPSLLPGRTRLVIGNAVYFKARWALPFRKSRTEKAPFYVSVSRTKLVDMMQGKVRARYAEGRDWQALALAYQGGRFEFLAVLPKQRDGLPGLERKLSPRFLEEVTGALTSRLVEVWLPRFRIDSSFELGAVLQELGMRLAFSPQADFSGITHRKPGLFVSEVVHVANCSVDEAGTEAAAATGVVMVTRALVQRKYPEFRADHPFVFLIWDSKTKTVLFLGRLQEP